MITLDIKKSEKLRKDHPTQKHYDQDFQLFSSFLDPYMKYSSGLWHHNTNSFEDAAVNMLDKIISFMPKLESASILEIGPGWGSLIKRCIHKNDGNLPNEYVAINPSKKQNEYLLEKIHSDVVIYETPFEELDIESLKNRFDIIVYLGSFAHMTNLDAITLKLEKCLKKNGKIIIEDTLYLSENHYKKYNDHPQTDFIQNKVFGIAPIPSLPKVIETAAHAGLSVKYMLEHSDSYQKTLNAWISRMKSELKNLPDWAFNSIVENTRYMELVQRAWGFTVGNYLLVLQKHKTRPNFIRPQKLSQHKNVLDTPESIDA